MRWYFALKFYFSNQISEAKIPRLISFLSKLLDTNFFWKHLKKKQGLQLIQFLVDNSIFIFQKMTLLILRNFVEDTIPLKLYPTELSILSHLARCAAIVLGVICCSGRTLGVRRLVRETIFFSFLHSKTSSVIASTIQSLYSPG